MTALPSFDLKGQVALVTGASSGIGRHLALLYAAAGASVAVCARREERLAETASAIAAEGGKALALTCDVTNPESIAAAVAATEDGLGPLSILVNNAGVAVTKSFLRHEEADWDYVLDTNLKGAALTAREFARHLVAKGRGGRIINMASIAGSRTLLGLSSYCASKAGVLHLTHALAMELARYDILVNALAPAYVETDMNREFLQSEAGKKLEARIPLRRAGQVEDLDGAALLLASPAGAYITGAVIPVDGGHAVASV